MHTCKPTSKHKPHEFNWRNIKIVIETKCKMKILCHLVQHHFFCAITATYALWCSTEFLTIFKKHTFPHAVDEVVSTSIQYFLFFLINVCPCHSPCIIRCWKDKRIIFLPGMPLTGGLQNISRLIFTTIIVSVLQRTEAEKYSWNYGCF